MCYPLYTYHHWWYFLMHGTHREHRGAILNLKTFFEMHQKCEINHFKPETIISQGCFELWLLVICPDSSQQAFEHTSLYRRRRSTPI